MRGYSRYRLCFFVVVSVEVTRYSFENLLGCIIKLSTFWLFIPLVHEVFILHHSFLVGWRVRHHYCYFDRNFETQGRR